MKKEDFQKKFDPVKRELQQAINAIERASHNSYDPHIFACLTASREHIERSLQNMKKFV